MWLADLEALRPHFDAFNAGVERAKDEYAAHPSAICIGVRVLVDGMELDCNAVRGNNDTLCSRCRQYAAAVKRAGQERAS